MKNEKIIGMVYCCWLRIVICKIFKFFFKTKNKFWESEFFAFAFTLRIHFISNFAISMQKFATGKIPLPKFQMCLPIRNFTTKKYKKKEKKKEMSEFTLILWLPKHTHTYRKHPTHFCEYKYYCGEHIQDAKTNMYAFAFSQFNNCNENFLHAKQSFYWEWDAKSR